MLRHHPRDILGIDSSASKAQIRKRYLSLMRRCHPDKLASIEDPKLYQALLQQGRDVQWAYDLLQNTAKLKAFEDQYQLTREIDLSRAIEYLHYDDDGNALGAIARQSDRYKQRFDEKIAEFEVKLPAESSAVDSIFVPLHAELIKQSPYLINNERYDSIYEYIAFQTAKKNDCSFVETIQNNLRSIMSIFRTFLCGQVWGDKLSILNEEISSLLESKLDARIQQMLTAVSNFTNASQIDPQVHFSSLQDIYSVMRVMTGSSASPIILLADDHFQYLSRQVHGLYLCEKKPQHLSKRWLSKFQRSKPLQQNEPSTQEQAYESLERDYAKAFSEDDAQDEPNRKMQTERIIEEAAKQIDMSEVRFLSSQDGSEVEETDPDNKQTNGSVGEPVTVEPIYIKSSSRSSLSARIGKSNHYLLSAIAYQCNANHESSQARVAASEALAMNLYQSAFIEARKASQVTKLYVFSQILSGILAFKYQVGLLSEFVSTVYHEFQLINETMPFVSYPLSHADIHQLTDLDEKWLYEVLNKTSKDETKSIEDRAKAAYLLFDGVFTGVFPSDKFDEIRMRSIETYLESEGQSTADISLYLHPANSLLKHAPTGSLSPINELNIPDVIGQKIIADVRGFEFNKRSGELSFDIVYWSENMPRSLRLMTEQEFYEHLQYKLDDLDKAWFTLDPPNDLLPHLPLQEARSSLPNIPLRQTMLDADYAALKFFTTTAVLSLPPYYAEDTAELLAHLPKHLTDVVLTNQLNRAGYQHYSTDPSRYWYKIGDVERFTTDNQESIGYQIGKVPLELAHQKMVVSLEGKLVDDKSEDELGKKITKALESIPRLEGLIKDVVDLEEKQQLEILKDELNGIFDVLDDVKRKIDGIKRHVRNDDSIARLKKSAAIRALTAELKLELDRYKTKKHQLQVQIKHELQLALDLNKVFARRMTTHMDELAQYVPILNRLRLFAKINALKDAFGRVKQSFSNQPNIIKQIELLTINAVAPPSDDPAKKIYVPAAIHRDSEIICFGGVSLQLSILETKVNSKIEQSKIYSNMFSFSNYDYSTNTPTADALKHARDAAFANFRMSPSDRIQLESAISEYQRELNWQQNLKSIMDSRFNPATSDMMTPSFMRQSGTDISLFQHADDQAGEVQEQTKKMAPLPAFASSASSVQSATLNQKFMPASASPSKPPPPPQQSPQAISAPCFLLPPNFDDDPHAQCRAKQYQNESTEWQAELANYARASHVLATSSQDYFTEMHQQAHNMLLSEDRTSSPCLNKFQQGDKENTLLDPISQFMIFQPVNAFAATVIGLANMPEAHPALQTCDYQLAKEASRNPSLYALSSQLITSEQSKHTIITPGYFLKATGGFQAGYQQTDSNDKSLSMLGIPPSPPSYHPEQSSHVKVKLSALSTVIESPEDLESLPGYLRDSMLFVINDKSQLAIHPYLTGADSIRCDTHNFLYFNPNTHDIEGVQALGTIDLSYASDQPAIDAVHVSPVFKKDTTARDIIHLAFNRQGFGDVSNKFRDDEKPRLQGKFGSKAFITSAIHRYLYPTNAWDEFKKFPDSVLTGIQKGVEEVFQVVLHPYDNLVSPMADLVGDTAIILNRLFEQYDPHNVMSLLQLTLTSQQKEALNIIQSQSVSNALYDAAVDRMKGRAEGLGTVAVQFLTSDLSERAEMTSEFMTSWYVLGGALKLGKAGVVGSANVLGRSASAGRRYHLQMAFQSVQEKMKKPPKKTNNLPSKTQMIEDITRLRLFGTKKKPSIFEVRKEYATYDQRLSILPKDFRFRSSRDVYDHLMRTNKIQGDYIYAIFDDGSMSLAAKYDKHALQHYGAYERAHHSQLGERPVVSAGELEVVRGYESVSVIRASNQSGHYQPHGDYQVRLNERVLINNGFDIRGRFDRFSRHEEVLYKSTHPARVLKKQRKQLKRQRGIANGTRKILNSRIGSGLFDQSLSSKPSGVARELKAVTSESTYKK